MEGVVGEQHGEAINADYITMPAPNSMTATTGVFTDEQIAQFARDGFVVVRGL